MSKKYDQIEMGPVEMDDEESEHRSDIIKRIAIVMTVTCALGALVSSVFNYIQYRNRQEYKKLTSEIDKGESVSFTSVEQCYAQSTQKADCGMSYDRAIKWDSTFGVSPNDNSSNICLQIQGDTCQDVILSDKGTVPSTIFINRLGLPILPRAVKDHPGDDDEDAHSIEYVHPVVGWQASARNLAQAVPLYESKIPGYGVRFDGMKVPLN